MEKGNKVGVLFLLLVLAISVFVAFNFLSSPAISGKVIIAEAIPIANGTIIIDEGSYTEFDGTKIQIATDTQDRKSLLLPIYWVYLLLGLIVVAIIVLLILIFVIPKFKATKRPESLPVVSRVPITKIVAKSDEYTKIINLVASATEDLDAGNIENAKTAYNNIELLFKTLSYPEKKELYEMSKALHDRISNVIKNAKSSAPVAPVVKQQLPPSKPLPVQGNVLPASTSKPMTQPHEDNDNNYYTSSLNK